MYKIFLEFKNWITTQVSVKEKAALLPQETLFLTFTMEKKLITASSLQRLKGHVLHITGFLWTFKEAQWLMDIHSCFICVGLLATMGKPRVCSSVNYR